MLMPVVDAQGKHMMMAVLFIFLAVVLIIGSALILLRTAKQPKLPDSVKVQPYQDDEDGW